MPNRMPLFNKSSNGIWQYDPRMANASKISDSNNYTFNKNTDVN